MHQSYKAIEDTSISVRVWNAKQDGNSEMNTSPLVHLLNTDEEMYLDKHPVFVKLLRRANVKCTFLLGIPVSFSSKHLPTRDTVMTLETEVGELYEVKYLTQRNAFSGGWRGFVFDKQLMLDDVAVFQLVEPKRFKIYIIRKGSSTDGLPTTIKNLVTKVTPDKKQPITYKRRNACQRLEMSNQTKTVHFRNITGFEDFCTILHQLLQHHELPELTLRTYYELCCANNTFLHSHLLKGLNTRFFGGVIGSIISKTVDIASAVTSCTIPSFLYNFLQWNKTLKYHEGLGMNVGVLLYRVRSLRNLAVSSEGAIVSSKYTEACRECPRAENEVKKLETVLAKLRKVSVLLADEVKAMRPKSGFTYLEACSKLVRVKDETRKLEVLLADFDKFFVYYHDVIETLKIKVEDHHCQFQEAARSPWIGPPSRPS